MEEACTRGHEEIVKILLQWGIDVHYRISYSAGALRLAAGGGHQSIVELSLEKGADSRPNNGCYGTVLQAAAEHGHESLVRMMLDMGFHPDAGEGYNGIPLQTASAEGHQSIVELLLEKGADVNRRSGFFLARHCRMSVARLLLEKVHTRMREEVWDCGGGGVARRLQRHGSAPGSAWCRSYVERT